MIAMFAMKEIIRDQGIITREEKQFHAVCVTEQSYIKYSEFPIESCISTAEASI